MLAEAHGGSSSTEATALHNALKAELRKQKHPFGYALVDAPVWEDCADPVCDARLAWAAGADQVLSTRIVDKHTAELSLLDPATGTVLIKQTFKGDDAGARRKAATAGALKLLADGVAENFRRCQRHARAKELSADGTCLWAGVAPRVRPENLPPLEQVTRPLVDVVHTSAASNGQLFFADTLASVVDIDGVGDTTALTAKIIEAARRKAGMQRRHDAVDKATLALIDLAASDDTPWLVVRALLKAAAQGHVQKVALLGRIACGKPVAGFSRACVGAVVIDLKEQGKAKKLTPSPSSSWGEVLATLQQAAKAKKPLALQWDT